MVGGFTSGLFDSTPKAMYLSKTQDAIVTGDNVRSSMLPPDVRTSLPYVRIPANALVPGGFLYVFGAGTIGARTAAPPGFNLVPWFQPSGGAKTDLPGFAQAPLLGTDGYCELWMKISQTDTGLRTAGVTKYWASTSGGAMAYSVAINGGGTGAAGGLPSVVASDYTVDRTIGVDGYWGSGADTREYVKCRGVSILLYPAG